MKFRNFGGIERSGGSGKGWAASATPWEHQTLVHVPNRLIHPFSLKIRDPSGPMMAPPRGRGVPRRELGRRPVAGDLGLLKQLPQP